MSTGAPLEPTQRFSNRVEAYIKYRPGYPAAVVDCLRELAGLRADSLIADVGCGTGKLAEVFLAAGHRVVGVEPNEAMREAGRVVLARYDRFETVAGSAEATTLPDASADLITAGQAFHWFDAPAARREFIRILKPGGSAALIWNHRHTTGTAFLEAYETLLNRHCPEYASIVADHADEAGIAAFFAPSPVTQARFDNEQSLDYAGLAGRLLSSSYAPTQGPGHDAMMRELKDIFTRHERDGRVVMGYDTKIFRGRFGPAA